jgi:hypothetical protein
MKGPKYPVEVLWCGCAPKSRRNGWEFPRAVKELLLSECDGLSVLHLFGGMADFGTRMDIDPSTKPHIVGDAWLPPFSKNAFDVVVVDPPYVGDFQNMNSQKVFQLMMGAAWIARRRVAWFHPTWIEYPARMKPEKAWLVLVGRSCVVRALQFFTPPEEKQPLRYFTRGPAIKYNRWIQQPQGLALSTDNWPLATGN